LHYAALQENNELVRVFLNAMDFNINAVDKFGNTALHYAASVGNVDIVRDLIAAYRKYEFNVSKTNKRGETALMIAWKLGHFHCGDLLVAYGGLNDEIRDKVMGLTAREWQQRRIAAYSDKLIDRPQTSNKPRSALQRINANNVPNYRPPSAPFANGRNSMTSFSNKENTDENNSLPAVIYRAKTTLNYRPASANDMRNNAQYIFQISPIEYFNKKKSQNSFPLADGKYKHHHSTSCQQNESNGSSWRRMLGCYLNRYNFQFAHSYRRPAVQPEPEVEEVQEERPESPTISETADSEQSRKINRKHSTNPNQKNLKDKMSKKSSTLTIPSNLTSVDSSSSESVNTKGLQRRVSRMSEGGERIKSAKRDGNQSRTANKK
jgi:hypothetical protein